MGLEMGLGVGMETQGQACQVGPQPIPRQRGMKEQGMYPERTDYFCEVGEEKPGLGGDDKN